jgi:hypothetical protein
MSSLCASHLGAVACAGAAASRRRRSCASSSIADQKKEAKATTRSGAARHQRRVRRRGRGEATITAAAAAERDSSLSLFAILPKLQPWVGLHRLNPVDPPYLRPSRRGASPAPTNPSDTPLDSAWFQPLTPKCDILASSLCFQMQLVPLPPGGGARVQVGDGVGEGRGADAQPAHPGAGSDAHAARPGGGAVQGFRIQGLGFRV